MNYIKKIRPEAEKYGICKIVPPSLWKARCPLMENGPSDNTKFTTKIQLVDLLQNRKPEMKNNSGSKRKRSSPSRMRACRQGKDTGYTLNSASENDKKFEFLRGLDFTVKEFNEYADRFKESYFEIENSSECSNLAEVKNKISRERKKKNGSKPTVADIEGEYWRIVEDISEEVVVRKQGI